MRSSVAHTRIRPGSSSTSERSGPARRRALHGQARADTDGGREQSRRLRLGEVDDVVAVEDAEGRRFSQPARELVEARLHGADETIGGQIGLAQSQHLRRQPEVAAVAGGVADVTEGDEKPAGGRAAPVQPRGKRALRLLEQPRFRAAYDLLALRAQLGLASPDIAAWWTRLQELSPDDRVKALDALPGA